MLGVGEYFENDALITSDVLTFAHQEKRSGRPEQNRRAGSHYSGAHSFPLALFLLHRVAQWRPVSISRADFIDREVEFARTSHASLGGSEHDGPHTRAPLRDDDKIVDPDVLGHGKLDLLAFIGGRGRNSLLQPASHLCAARNDHVAEAKAGERQRTADCSEEFLMKH